MPYPRRPRWTRIVRDAAAGMDGAHLRATLGYYRSEIAGPMGRTPGLGAVLASRAAIVRAELRRRGEAS